jgi:hypothetical protein
MLSKPAPAVVRVMARCRPAHGGPVRPANGHPRNSMPGRPVDHPGSLRHVLARALILQSPAAMSILTRDLAVKTADHQLRLCNR